MSDVVMIRKKLIEVDLPLDEINAESKREKSIRHGHPSTLHIWWARRPLAACRAVIFASMVDDPSSCPDEFPTEDAQRAERSRLHDIIRKIVRWESADESKAESRRIQSEARYEIARSIARSHGEVPPRPDDQAEILQYLRDRAPPIHDPFAGGGSIPLEAHRLGLQVIASDLNPVAVLINKALIELPFKFLSKPPVHPDATDISDGVSWRGAAGLANDVLYYGKQMYDETFKRIGHLYPKVRLPNGGEATVIAWLWARTTICPNPACGATMPLISNFQLSKKPNNLHWVRPIIDRENNGISFVVQNHNEGVPEQGTVNRNGATCIVCSTTAPLSYVREQSRIGQMGKQMIAIVAKGTRKRLFFSPIAEHIKTAHEANPSWRPVDKLPDKALGFRIQAYGFIEWHQLFTNRQLDLLATLIDVLPTIHNKLLAQYSNTEYANIVCTYLALVVSKLADAHSNFVTYLLPSENIAHVFGRQAISMVWDFAEGNPFSNSARTLLLMLDKITKVVKALPTHTNCGNVQQADAATAIHANQGSVIVTDPPYYDNIGYSDLSDFFYVWLRPMLRDMHPRLFASMLVPKDDEMVAAPRFQNPRERFERMMSNVLHNIREHASPEFPSSIFYAYKQEEKSQDGRASTGWETMLSALVSAGFQIVGTWPMRTEGQGRLRSHNSNALTSSVVLVCRRRPDNAVVTTRRQFVDILRTELPTALTRIQDSNIAPVDLAQASIGPGMAVFTRYSKVLDASGNIVSVRDALTLINQTLDEVLAEQEGDFDADTRWALSWFEQSGFDRGDFGVAETLSKAKNTSVSGMVEAGILEAGAGKVRLLRPRELPKDWDPKKDKRFTVWEATHHLVRALDQGEAAAAKIMSNLGSTAEAAREMAYRLYRTCEQKNHSQEAQDYNALVQSWPEILRLARERMSRQAPRSTGMKMHDDR